MGRTYIVKSEWFEKKDILGYKISQWCKKSSDSEVLCFICNKKVCCQSKGYSALVQHVTTSVHAQNATLKLNKKQMLLSDPRSNENNEGTSGISNNSLPLKSVNLFNQSEEITKAEAIWAMKTVQCNMSVRSSDDLKEIFQAMFPSHDFEHFSLSHSKLGYLITEALGPYFFKQLIEEVKGSYYALLYDETTNNENKKELQIVLRFWSSKEKCVVSHYLKTLFIGHAKATDIVSCIRKTMTEADLKMDKLLMIGSDGPNVNKAVKRILSSQLIEERGKPLIDIGSCNIHIVHTAFLKGVEKLGEECSDLIIDLYNFFKGFPSRQEDYENIQQKTNVPSNKFLKHVPTRWLTLAPAAERLLQQWSAIENYFLKYIPLKSSELMKTPKYQRIAKILKTKNIKVECEFLIESSKVFINFTEHFQRNEPLIHVLNDELKKILTIIAGRVCKVKMININEQLTSDKLLPINKIDCHAVSNSLLLDNEKSDFLINVQKHYVAAYNYLFTKLSKESDLLPHFKCLQPCQITKASSIRSICLIAKAMPFKDMDTLLLKDEWRLLQLEKDILKQDNSTRIDKFWSNVIYSSESQIKYPKIAQVVQAALCLSHGNSDVEREFSYSGRVLTEEKSRMSEKMLNCRLIVKDALKKYNNRVATVPISKELISLCQSAHKSYKVYLDEKRKKAEDLLRKEEEEKIKRKKEEELNKELSLKRVCIKTMEMKADALEKEKQTTQKSADALLKEASQRLSVALSKGDNEGMQIAQGLLIGAEELRKRERQQEEETIKLNKAVNKRKTTLIDMFAKSKIQKK